MRLAAPFVVLFVLLLAITPTTGFYDLYLLPWQTRLIFLEHPDFWRALEGNGMVFLPGTGFSALPYGPLFYYPLGAWVWLMDATRVIDMHAWSNFNFAAGSPRYAAVLKFPNLAVYIAVGLVLLRCLPGEAGVSAMLLWLLNPAVIFVSFVMGQNDAWSMLTVLAALLLATRWLRGEREVRVFGRALPADMLAMVALGAGAAVKLHPLMLVVPFALAMAPTWGARLRLAAIAMVTFAVLIAPFVWDPLFRDHALFNPQGQDILRYKAGHLSLFYPAYAVTALIPLAMPERPYRALLASIGAVHLIVFALTGWPPERAAWFVGALVVPAVLYRAALMAYVLVTLQVLIHAMGLGTGFGAGVFDVLTPRLAGGAGLDAAVSRVVDFDRVEAATLIIAIVAWAIALAVLLLDSEMESRPRAVPVAVPFALLLVLPAYFAASLAYTSGGVTSEHVPGPTSSVLGPATVEQPLLLSAYDDLSGVDLRYDIGSAAAPLTAAVAFEDAALGEAQTVPMEAGDNARLRFATVSGSRGLRLRVELHVPAGARLRMVQPPSGSFAAAIVNGGATKGIVDVQLHYDRNWGGVWRDVRHKLAGHIGVFIATALTLGVALGFAWRQAALALWGREAAERDDLLRVR